MADTTTEIQSQIDPAAGNGAKLVPPAAVSVTREDVLNVILLHERERRINAELIAVRADATLNKLLLSQKYGVDFNKYTLNIDQGVAVRNPDAPSS